MRTSSYLSYAASIDNLQKRQNELTDSQQRLTSGLRVLRASDDPTAAARAERARALIQRSESTQRAVEASRTSMTLTEASLADGGELIQQARELVVAAGNASYSDAERANVADQIAAIRKQLLSVANRSDGSGGYVFSGQGAARPPFLERPGGVDYVGTGGAVRVASEEPLPLTLDGGEVWLSSATGNGTFETRNVKSANAWIVLAADSAESFTCWPEMLAKISAADGPSSWRTATMISEPETPLAVAPPLPPLKA